MNINKIKLPVLSLLVAGISTLSLTQTALSAEAIPGKCSLPKKTQKLLSTLAGKELTSKLSGLGYTGIRVRTKFKKTTAKIADLMTYTDAASTDFNLNQTTAEDGSLAVTFSLNTYCELSPIANYVIKATDAKGVKKSERSEVTFTTRGVVE